MVSPSPLLPRSAPWAALMVWSSSWFLQALFSKSCFPSSTSLPAPLKAKHNLGSLGSSGENSLSLSLISGLEKIGMLFTRFPSLGLLAFALGPGKGRPWREQLHACPPAPLFSLLSCSHPNCGPPTPCPARILLNCAIAREAAGGVCGVWGVFPRFNPVLSPETSSPKKS